MNILVCAKQIPDPENMNNISFADNRLVRDDVELIINPFDSYAMEMAAQIKDRNDGTKIIALTFGKDQAKKVLKECVSVGADKAYLVSDPAFAGSDTYETAKAISRAVRKIEETEGKIDVIICGKQSADGENAQIGPMIAALLEYPCITGCVDGSAADGGLLMKKELDAGHAMINVSLPCVLTMAVADFQPRFPTIKTKMAANRAEITVLTAADIEADNPGFENARVTVKTIAPAPKRGECVMEKNAADLVAKLRELHAV